MQAERGQSPHPWSHIRAIYAFAAVVGVCPVFFSKGQLRQSTTMVLYSTVVFCAVFHNGFVSGIKLPYEYQNMSIVLANIILRFFDIGLRGAAIISFLNASSYNKILKELQEIDAILSTMRAPRASLSFLNRSFEVTTTIVFCILLLINGIWVRHMFFNLLMTLVLGTASSQFLAIGMHIDVRLEQTITCLLQTDRSHPLGRTRRVEVLSNIHSRLCDIVEQFASIYSFQLLIMATNTFFFTNTRMFAMYYIRDYTKPLFYLRIYWTVLYYHLLWRIAACCNNLNEKLRDFNTALFRYMIHSKEREILDSGKLRLHIAMQREATFTACGFFHVDYPLIHSIISSATTYLLVQIQIDDRTLEENHSG